MRRGVIVTALRKIAADALLHRPGLHRELAIGRVDDERRASAPPFEPLVGAAGLRFVEPVQIGLAIGSAAKIGDGSDWLRHVS